MIMMLGLSILAEIMILASTKLLWELRIARVENKIQIMADNPVLWLHLIIEIIYLIAIIVMLFMGTPFCVISLGIIAMIILDGIAKLKSYKEFIFLKHITSWPCIFLLGYALKLLI